MNNLKRDTREFTLQKNEQNETVKPKTSEDSTKALNNIPKLVSDLQSTDRDVVLKAATEIRKLLAVEVNPPIDEVINSGGVPILANLLNESDETLQFEVAWCLSNIASGTSTHTECVVQSGCVPTFISLLSSPNENVKEQSVWALGNIAGDSAKQRDFVLQMGAVEATIQLISNTTNKTVLRNATWALSNFCRGKPFPTFTFIAPAIPTFAQLLHHEDKEILIDAAWGLAYSSEGENRIDAIISTGCLKRIVELLSHPDVAIINPVLRIVGNIVSGNDLQTQAVLDCGALPLLRNLINHNNKMIRKETCWTLSNITAGDHNQIQSVIDADLIPLIIQMVYAYEFDVRREAVYALCNAIEGSTLNQFQYLIDHGTVKALCNALTTKDVKTIHVALEGIRSILKRGASFGSIEKYKLLIEEASGLDHLENLQTHNNTKIYNLAVNILENYFDIEEEEEVFAAAAAS